MSLYKFDLKEEHITLLRQLNWQDIGEISDKPPRVDEKRPFGNSNIIEDVGLILFGPPTVKSADDEGEMTYTEEQTKEMETLYGELGTAMDIVMYTGKFETGHYRTKTYLRDWIKKD